MEYKYHLQSFHVEAEHRQLSKHNQHVLLRGSLTKQTALLCQLAGKISLLVSTLYI